MKTELLGTFIITRGDHHIVSLVLSKLKEFNMIADEEHKLIGSTPMKLVQQIRISIRGLVTHSTRHDESLTNEVFKRLTIDTLITMTADFDMDEYIISEIRQNSYLPDRILTKFKHEHPKESAERLAIGVTDEQLLDYIVGYFNKSGIVPYKTMDELKEYITELCFEDRGVREIMRLVKEFVGSHNRKAIGIADDYNLCAVIANRIKHHYRDITEDVCSINDLINSFDDDE